MRGQIGELHRRRGHRVKERKHGCRGSRKFSRTDPVAARPDLPSRPGPLEPHPRIFRLPGPDRSTASLICEAPWRGRPSRARRCSRDLQARAASGVSHRPRSSLIPMSRRRDECVSSECRAAYSSVFLFGRNICRSCRRGNARARGCDRPRTAGVWKRLRRSTRRGPAWCSPHRARIFYRGGKWWREVWPWMPRALSRNLLGGFSFRAFRRRAGLLCSDGFLRGYCLFWFVPRIACGSFFDVTAAIARDLGKKFITDDGARSFDGHVFRGSVLIAMLDEQPRFPGTATPAMGANEHPGTVQLFAVKIDLQVAL